MIIFLNLLLKRIMDFFGSFFGIIIISPLLILIAIAIKVTSKGPVLFKQERLGKDGKVFKIIKFRTMVVNAEKMGSGLTVKNNNDNRITKVGKLLRATSLDELPQLFNVLNGSMSLVGPRPPVPNFPYQFNKYSEKQKKRFAVKPGITGLSQVTVRNSVPWDDRILLDINYVETFNIFLDLTILFKTLFKLFKSDDIYFNSENNKQTKV